MSDLPLKFLDADAHGVSLLPAIAQDHLTGEIRMVAFATRDAVEKTLETGRATFYSRSRRELWEKGLTSGNGLRVVEVRVDCDADCVVYSCEPEGPSCHTGAPSCFFRVLEGGALVDAPERPQTLLARLEAMLEARKSSTEGASYTKSLYEKGPIAIGKKIREEAGELADAIERESDDRVVSEAADALYHMMVGLRARGVALRRVFAELAKRFGTSGHAEKAARGKPGDGAASR